MSKRPDDLVEPPGIPNQGGGRRHWRSAWMAICFGRCRAAARKQPNSGWRGFQASARHLCILVKNSCAARASPTCSMWRELAAFSRLRRQWRRRDRYWNELRRAARGRRGHGRTDRSARRNARGLLRAVRRTNGCAGPGPQGQDGRRDRHWDPAQHIFCASMAAQVGLDPSQDIRCVAHPPAEAKRLLAGRRDRRLSRLPARSQELRAKKIGHLLVNSAVGPAMVAILLLHGRRPTASSPRSIRSPSGAVRAILKGGEMCAPSPSRAARI